MRRSYKVLYHNEYNYHPFQTVMRRDKKGDGTTKYYDCITGKLQGIENYKNKLQTGLSLFVFGNPNLKNEGVENGLEFTNAANLYFCKGGLGFGQRNNAWKNTIEPGWLKFS